MVVHKRDRCVVIAEAGVNHNGSVDMAHTLIDAAADSGADIVKFQSFKADKLATPSAEKAAYQVKHTGADQSQVEMLKKLELSEKDQRTLFLHCQDRGIEFLSSPFDTDSLAFLIDLGVKRIKLGSGELTNAPMLLEVARSRLPIILSTGMSTLAEVETALGVLAHGYLSQTLPLSSSVFEASWTDSEAQLELSRNVTLLHCTTEYPAPANQINLLAMQTLREAFGLACGYSDHTEGIAVSLAAVALGACMIEKHFTLDRNLTGPDHKASMNAAGLKSLVDGVREVEASLGSRIKVPTSVEIPNRTVARKSLVAARNINKGQIIDVDDVSVKRPGTGLTPLKYWDIIGTRAVSDFAPNDLLTLYDFDGEIN